VSDVQWFGTVRGRLGYAAGPWLVYGTGGVAFGNVKTSIEQSSFSGSVDRAGWTAGAGVEYQFLANWSAKVEYLHVDLGNDIRWTTFGNDPGLTSVDFDVVRAGVNYHFGSVYAPLK
jgi:outer membrane immunogenic protein